MLTLLLLGLLVVDVCGFSSVSWGSSFHCWCSVVGILIVVAVHSVCLRSLMLFAVIAAVVVVAVAFC